jgi:hypothetical protein
MIFHVQTLEIVMQSQDYVNVLVEGGDLLVVVKPFFSNSGFISMQNETFRKNLPVVYLSLF